MGCTGGVQPVRENGSGGVGRGMHRVQVSSHLALKGPGTPEMPEWGMLCQVNDMG